MKDDVLNTRYISHYDQTYGKEVKINKSEEAIEKIEEHLAKLRYSMKELLHKGGQNTEVLEELQEDHDLERQSIRDYEKFITDKTRFRPVELIVDAYEGILEHGRVDEKNTLNKKRFTEYETNRPP